MLMLRPSSSIWIASTGSSAPSRSAIHAAVEARRRLLSSVGEPAAQHGPDRLPPTPAHRSQRVHHGTQGEAHEQQLRAKLTELAENRQAPAIAQRIGGAARDLIREVPPEDLRDGR